MNTRGSRSTPAPTAEDEPGDHPQPTQARADAMKQVSVGEEVDPDPIAAPMNKDVPYVSGTAAVGSTLNCTMGNWTGEPTGYAYQWMSGTDAAGPNSGDPNTYTVADSDAGKDLTCVVTATNDIGSTAAPPSNVISIPPAAATA